jgi:hypothetical protein
VAESAEVAESHRQVRVLLVPLAGAYSNPRIQEEITTLSRLVRSPAVAPPTEVSKGTHDAPVLVIRRSAASSHVDR